jgi:hypothetical protein
MKIAGICATLTLIFAATTADAGVYADDLSKCLVSKSSQSDQDTFIRWVFAAMSSSPAVRSMSSITDAQFQQYNKSVADLFTRLLTSDCHDQTVAALKYEGENSLQGSFQVLGQAAFRGLLTSPDVQKHMSGLNDNVDKQKLEALSEEAGLPPSSPGK